MATKLSGSYQLPLLTRTIQVTSAPEIGVGGGLGTYNPPGIPSAEAFGSFTATRYATPTSIPSAEAFGSFLGIGGGRVAALLGIPSGEAFGVPTFRTHFHPASIISREAFGAVTFKNQPEPIQIVVTLVGGPYDGESRIVEQPWPRHMLVIEDETTGQHYTYFVDVDKLTEPYTATYSANTSELPDTETEDYLGMGEKGDRGEQGETGPQGPAGADGISFIVDIPTATVAMTSAGWAVSGDGDWMQAPSGLNVVGYEPFGYRYEGNYLVCKGVVAATSAVNLLTPFTRPAATIGGPVLMLKTTDNDYLEVGYAWWNGTSITVPYTATGANIFAAGWAGVHP